MGVTERPLGGPDDFISHLGSPLECLAIGNCMECSPRNPSNLRGKDSRIDRKQAAFHLYEYLRYKGWKL